MKILSGKLKRWIAQSESWQSFVDFKIPEEEKAEYEFYQRYDDFYLSLMNGVNNILNEDNLEDQSEDILSLAKGLEIYSLKKKKEYFEGVSQALNMHFISGLYYLANYSASAWLLSKLYGVGVYESDINRFISLFLRRERKDNNIYSGLFDVYLKTGNSASLDNFVDFIDEQKKNVIESGSLDYLSYKLASSILCKFKSENIWSDLLNINNDPKHWAAYIKNCLNKKVPVWSLFPSQRSALQNGIMNDETCSLQMPTSSGKTFICELVIYNEFKKNKDCKILYLAPYRALASELKQSLGITLNSFGITSKTIYGGNIPTVDERNSIENANLLIATPEKFMAIEKVFPEIFNNYSLIICDEGHLLDDDNRGSSYELLLSRLKGDNSSKRRFIFISAIIPNIEDVNLWLGGTKQSVSSSDYRPTNIEFAFLKRMTGRKRAFYLDINPTEKQPYNYQLYKFLSENELILELNEKQKYRVETKKGITASTALKAFNAGAVAVFAPTKGGSSGVMSIAEEILKQIELVKDKDLQEYCQNSYFDSLIEYFSIIFGANYSLVKCTQKGILFHHGDLPQSVREIIEDSIKKDKIKLIVCTNTLAEGVNLPIKTLVIHSTKRYNPDVIGNFEEIQLRDLKNLVGRAGRAGKETKGIIIIPHDDLFKRITLLIKDDQNEKVKGWLHKIIINATKIIEKTQLVLSNEILDQQDESFQVLLDSIDKSLIDLLTEEIEINNLKELINSLISRTFSYHQANESEKQTLFNFFNLRCEKLLPYIEKKEFKILKNSGSSIRLYDDIIEKIDFEHTIWDEEFSILDDIWLNFILDECVFSLDHFESHLDLFNENNGCEMSNELVKNVIKLWMNGEWFHNISIEVNHNIDKTLKIVNYLIGYKVQNVISTIIRIKELKVEEDSLSPNITNWTAYLQYGINNHIQLALFELGLNDRISVWAISNFLDRSRYVYIDRVNFVSYLKKNKSNILNEIKYSIPVLSLEMMSKFLTNLKYKNML